MYLLQSSPRPVQKWRMGGLNALGCNCSTRGIGAPPQKRMGRLGQDAGVPAGTVLAYTSSWHCAWNAMRCSPNQLQMAIQPNLANAYGIVVDSQVHSTSDWVSSGDLSFTLQVHTTSDYAAPDDIRQIIDHAIYSVIDAMPNSTIRVVKSVAGGAVSLTQQIPVGDPGALAAAQAGYADALARGDSTAAAQFAAQIAQLGGKNPLGAAGWFSANWPWLAAAGIGFVAVKELL